MTTRRRQEADRRRQNAPAEAQSPRRDRLLCAALAAALTLVFWWPLWTGGGLIGGDHYSYYLPQKLFYADRLEAGEFPLWNNRTGHGYPLLGESQTAALYPLNLVLYRLTDVNTAHAVSHLLHYILAYVFAWMFARRLGLSSAGALFAALVYTYGWFPSRSCWEWAIIGGTWFPLALWCAESWLQFGRRWFLLLLSAVLGVQMLAGHYNLAFITLLTIAAYVPLRLWFSDSTSPQRQQGPESVPPRNSRGWLGSSLRAPSKFGAKNDDAGGSQSLDPSHPHLHPRLVLTGVGIALVAGFALAAVQLVPTWELKQQSQREGTSRAFDPGYGHIPPLYWSQIFTGPFLWYAPDIDTDRAIANLTWLASDSGTNKVEAHLYFGLVPVVLVVGLLVRYRQGTDAVDRRLLLFGALGLAALVYTSGWFVPLTRHLPGFGFFMGPGRYGIVTTLATALLAGRAVDLFGDRAPAARRLILPALFLLTVADLWYVSRLVTYSVMVDSPPIESAEDSPVAKLLAGDAEASRQPVRVFAPGPNLVTLTGAAQTPVYLGLGPEEYFDPALTMPAGPEGESGLTTAQIEWLQRAGVTHLLRFEPLDERRLPVTKLWEGFDPLLSAAWARFQEPLYLYTLAGSRGRATFEEDAGASDVRFEAYRANEVRIAVESQRGGRLILTDLFYPGWDVTIDGTPAEGMRFEGMYRAVEVPAGRHTVVWRYRPRSVYWGAAVSLMALLVLAVVAVSEWRRSKRA